jgi:hypothetical protein
MVGNLFTSILVRYSTIDNVVVETVKKGVIRCAAQDVSLLDINRAWVGGVQCVSTQLLKRIRNLLVTYSSW